MKYTYMALLILQSLLIAVFLYCTYQADLAMGKDGIGNIIKFDTLNKYAGIAFYLAHSLWLFVLLLSVVKRQFALNEARLAIAVPPLVIIFGWVSLWFI